MHHCALRLFRTPFTAAAARAWVRAASQNPNGNSQQQRSLEGSPSTPLWERYENTVSSFYESRNAIKRQGARFRRARGPSVTCSQVDETHFQNVDPGRSYTHDFDDDANDIGVPVGNHPLETRPTIRVIPVPTTPASLYRNLHYIISYRPTLPALVDYHDLYPKLRSTRSYNLVIWYALRHCSFGTVGWLLGAMRADGLSESLETRKLHVRWLVQTGFWDQAWDETLRLSKARSSGIPLALWLEFFRTVKRGIRRRRGEHDRSDLDITRYRALMANPPFPALHETAQVPPRAVYYVMSMMLRTGHSKAAHSLAEAYFKRLPRKLSGRWTRHCLEIVHLQITKGCPGRGLKKFYEARRVMNRLVSLHAGVRPSSGTLFRLLGPLRQAKRCGTIGWCLLEGFRSQWGARTEDRRVRRRVAGLGLKEGRKDVVGGIVLRDERWRSRRGEWRMQESVLGGVSKHDGREERAWHVLMSKVREKDVIVKKKRSAFP